MTNRLMLLVVSLVLTQACSGIVGGSDAGVETGGGVGGGAGATGGGAGTTGGGDGSAGGGTTSTGGGTTTGGGTASTGGGSGSTGGGSGCEPFGHWPAPTNTFTLPVPANGHLAYNNIQTAFPNVDWQTLDRLYIPAGVYKTLRFDNLPTRTAARPLIITNKGGQVQVGPNDNGNFIWAMSGGANWIVTGRYDPDAQTGDVNFPGHRCGAYANSQGKYGIISDDAFDLDAPYTHMGISIGSATDFELDFIEVTRSGFAGVRLINSRSAGDPARPMANLKIHDLYVHDTDGEGFYFGWTGQPPSNLFPNLQVYNNRIIRTGTETLQIQDMGEGSRIHHNVLAFGALHWLDAFSQYQDGNVQALVREGTVEFDHNIIIGGAGTFLSFFSSPQSGDGARNVTFHDNYWADTRSLGGYLNGNSTAPSSITFRDNVFRGLNFSYTAVNPSATDPGVVFGVNGANQAPISFTGNKWEGSRALLSGIQENGTRMNITATGNARGTVPEVTFVNWGYPNVPTSKLTLWGDVATLAPGMPMIQYAVGDLVMHDGQLFRAKTANTNKVPPANPADWEQLARPADDVRVAPGSTYEGMGVQ